MPRRQATDQDSVLTYAEVRERIGDTQSYLLLGNGFSIACHESFRYRSLYESAVAAGLSERAQLLFDRIGTNNFEGVMRLLEQGDWIARAYGLLRESQSEMLRDLQVIKTTLVQAVATSHLETPGDIESSRKRAAADFFTPYHIVFTTNYDLLPYWVVMAMGTPPPLEDCFRADQDEPAAPYLVFSQRLKSSRGLLYLHGALHLFVEEGELRKHSWSRTGRRLTDLIREGLEVGQYPLFVAEGSPEKKLQQIQANGYLWYCMEKLRAIRKPLVIFGHSLGSSDAHICAAIASNIELVQVYVGLFGDPDSEANAVVRAAAQQMILRRSRFAERRAYRPLEVVYYSSDSVRVWG